VTGPVVVASANAVVGIDAAWDVLAAGGTALDAVEVATRLVEDNAEDHTVGTGGYPNLLGEVELDASIMDGATRRAGAVGALRGFRNPVSVARAVLERLPHVLLVGDGAAAFAEAIGAERADLLTAEAERVWRAKVERVLAGRATVEELVAGRAGVDLADLTRLATDPDRVAGTVDVLAVDGSGHLAAAVSTSGWAWKHPGRVGDSPLVGAGNYADDRAGAAACTGFGELAIRSGTAARVVAGMAAGLDVEAACTAALHDLAGMARPGEPLVMNVVALAPDGSFCAATTDPAQRRQFVVRTAAMAAAELRDRVVVDVA
jgi:L-asparaginase / beta-aspartyl-peptidase